MCFLLGVYQRVQERLETENHTNVDVVSCSMCVALLTIFRVSMCFLDWFDVLDNSNLPLLTEWEVIRNLQAIINNADMIGPVTGTLSIKPLQTLIQRHIVRPSVRGTIGVLSTENRKIWSSLCELLSRDPNNKAYDGIVSNDKLMSGFLAVCQAVLEW